MRRGKSAATQKLLSGDMWARVRHYRAYQTKVSPTRVAASPLSSAAT